MVLNMGVGTKLQESMYHVDAFTADGHQEWGITSAVLLIGVELEMTDEVGCDIS